MKLNREQQEEIISKFNTGEYSYPMLAKEYNLSVSAIFSFLKRRKIRPKEDSYFYHSKRKFHLNEHYFNIIDSKENSTNIKKYAK